MKNFLICVSVPFLILLTLIFGMRRWKWMDKWGAAVGNELWKD